MWRLERVRARIHPGATRVDSSERTPVNLAETIVNQASEVSIITPTFHGAKLKGKPSQIVFSDTLSISRSMMTAIQEELAQKAAGSYRETDSGNLLLVAHGRRFGIKGVVLYGNSAKAAFKIDGVPSSLQTKFIDALKDDPYKIMSQVIDAICGPTADQEKLACVKTAFPEKQQYSTSPQSSVRVHQFIG